MDINDVHNLEKSVVTLLNLVGWDLEWCGDNYTHFDAKGLTPKKKECVIEMKFRKKYYKTKMLEVSKYERLMNINQDVHKLYLVIDTKAMYIFG